MLAELDPVLDEEGRLLWSPVEEGEAELIFLGLEGESPLFAPLVRTGTLGQRAWGVFRLLAPDEPARRGDLGRGAKPQRMAQPPRLLRHVRRRRPHRSAPAGAGAAPAAAPSISRASIRS